jgi:hypothetical protein
MLKNMVVATTAAAVMSGAMASVAQAQPGRYYGGGYEYRYGHGYGGVDRLKTSYVDSLNWQIWNAARGGRISWREARALENELNQVKPLAWRYETGQARPWEIDRLQRTVDRIDSEVRG